MAQYLGDYAAGETVHFMWNSADSNGASITRSTNGTISVYKDTSTTQTTTGVTDTEDFDGLTGVHHVAIATSDAFYTTGTDFMVVLSAATIDTRTVNAVLAHFSIENRAALRPTTAGRTLDVSATGAAGVDWANVESQSTSVNLSATTVNTVNTATAVTTVNGLAAGVITAASVATGAIDADALAADASAEIADAVWDEALSGHLTAGSTGAALDDAGAAGDPWATALPGAYGAGTAGKIVGDNLNATVSSRATQTSVDTIDDLLDTEIAAIKAKTDNLPTDPADASDIAAAFTTVNTKLDTIDDFLDTEVAAIKAKTDNLPTDPADASDIAAAFTTVNTKLDTIDDLLDTEVAAIKADTAAILADTGTDGVVVADKTGFRLSATGVDDILDEVVEGAVTLRQSARLSNSANGGKVAGAATTSVTIRDVGDSKNRVAATVDADGNRSAVTLDLT